MENTVYESTVLNSYTTYNIYIYVYTVVAISSTHPSRDPMGVFLDPGLLPESINFNEPSPRALDLPVPVTLVAAGGVGNP